MVFRRNGALSADRGRRNFRIALASDEILRRRTLLVRLTGPRAYFAVFSDHRANVDLVSPSDWTLFCLSKVLTGIRDEREVRSCGARPLFLPHEQKLSRSLDQVRNSTRDIRLRLFARVLIFTSSKFHCEIKLNSAALTFHLYGAYKLLKHVRCRTNFKWLDRRIMWSSMIHGIFICVCYVC